MKDYVLKDIDLKIDKGECIGIMGLSGSERNNIFGSHSWIDRTY